MCFFAHDEVILHWRQPNSFFFHISQLANVLLLEKKQEAKEIRTCHFLISRHAPRGPYSIET